VRIDGIAMSNGTIAIADPYTNSSTASAPTPPISVSIRTLGPPLLAPPFV